MGTGEAVKKRLIGVSLWMVLIAGATANGDTITLGSWGFSNITHTNTVNAAIGEAQLTVDLVDRGGVSPSVAFLFKNAGPKASSITDLYFDDGSNHTLLQIADLVGSTGVRFSVGATPGNLPGANNASPRFRTTLGLSADSDSPVQPNGVNPGEWLSVVFDLQSGKTSASVLDDLVRRDLRIGIHVQGFANGGSESFVNGSLLPRPSGVDALGAEVPSPSALLGIDRSRHYHRRPGSATTQGRALRAMTKSKYRALRANDEARNTQARRNDEARMTKGCVAVG